MNIKKECRHRWNVGNFLEADKESAYSSQQERNWIPYESYMRAQIVRGGEVAVLIVEFPSNGSEDNAHHCHPKSDRCITVIFLTGGMLATDPFISSGENSNIRLHPRFKMPDGRNGEGGLYGVNFWLVWSEYVPANKCLKCSYCFLSMFSDILPPEYQATVGMSPSRIFDYE